MQYSVWLALAEEGKGMLKTCKILNSQLAGLMKPIWSRKYYVRGKSSKLIPQTSQCRASIYTSDLTRETSEEMISKSIAI